MTIRYAYNTNGTVHHRLGEAVALIGDSGYDGVAVTIDQNNLDPMSPGWERRTETLAGDLARRGLGAVVEGGARFVLDPRDKHQPTLISPTSEGRERRLEFLFRSLDIAAMLQAEAMTFWSGAAKPGVVRTDAMAWLGDGLGRVLEHADRVGVTAAMEPEPEMLVGTVDHFAAVAAAFPRLALALDLGHVMVTQERVPEEAIVEFADRIGTVSLEDMKRGHHVHLAFGDGDMDIAACLASLERIGFRRLVCVELSSDSGRADVMVPEARRFLRACQAVHA